VTQPKTETVDPWASWQIELGGFEVGETYVVRAHHVSGVWGDFLITAVAYHIEDDLWEINVETCLDGSPGLVDGWDSKRLAQP